MRFFLVVLILVLSIVYLTESKKVKGKQQETTKDENKKKVETKKSKDEVGENKKKPKENKKQQTKTDREKKKTDEPAKLIKETVEKKKYDKKVDETVRGKDENVKLAKKKSGKVTKDEPEMETIVVQAKKLEKAIKGTKIDVVPEESVKQKKPADLRKHQSQTEKTAADNKRQKRKTVHTTESCDRTEVAAPAECQNERGGGNFESNKNEQIVVSGEEIQTIAEKVAAVEHPHENDAI